MWDQAWDYLPLGGLVMLLLFGRSGLYRERAQRPGLPRVIASLFQTTVAVLLYALLEGRELPVVLHLLRVALLRADLRVGASAGRSSA